MPTASASSRVCASCGHRVRTTIPRGGDGSVEVFVRHGPDGLAPTGGVGGLCAGARMEAPVLDEAAEGVRNVGQLRDRTKPGRGGARAGAGRKASVGARVRSFTLDESTTAKIAAWQADPHNRAASLSEALRQMVDLADRRRSAVRHYTKAHTRGADAT